MLFYDADRVPEAAATKDPQDLYEAQRSILLDPHDPRVVEAAIAEGIPHSWIDAAQQSPIWDLIFRYDLALPLHPEYRTLPMVWYVPPLSPVVDSVTASGLDGEDHKVLLTTLVHHAHSAGVLGWFVHRWRHATSGEITSSTCSNALLHARYQFGQ